MVDINKIQEYFFKIDSSKDGILQKDEVLNAQKENTIFSQIIKENMNDETFYNLTVEYDKNSPQFQEKPYKLEEPAAPQNWEWDIVSRVLTKEEVDNNIFNINSREGVAIPSDINFNSEDGKYMIKHLSFDSETFKDTKPENLPPNFEPDKVLELGK